MSVYRIHFTQQPTGEFEVLGRAISNIRQACPDENRTEVMTVFSEAIMMAHELVETVAWEQWALELREVADASVIAGFTKLAVSDAEALSGFTKQVDAAQMTVNSDQFDKAPQSQRSKITRRGENISLLPKIAERLVDMHEIDGFKHLLTLSAYDLLSAYRMCELLAFVYPDASNSIVEAISHGGFE